MISLVEFNSSRQGAWSCCQLLRLPTRVVNIIKTIPECLTGEARARMTAERGVRRSQGAPWALHGERNRQQGELQSSTCYPVFATAQLPDEKTIRSFQIPVCSFPLAHGAPCGICHISLNLREMKPNCFHIHFLCVRTQRESQHPSGYLLWEQHCLMSKHA